MVLIVGNAYFMLTVGGNPGFEGRRLGEREREMVVERLLRGVGGLGGVNRVNSVDRVNDAMGSYKNIISHQQR